MNIIKDWFHSRDSREQILILSVTIISLVLIIHALIWTPISHAYHKSHSKLQNLTRDVIWMRQAQQKILALQAITKQSSSKTANQSMQTVIYKTAENAQLQQTVKNTIPQNQNRYRIQLEQARFDNIIQWIELLAHQYSIKVEYIDISRTKKIGLVNANLILNRVQ